MGKLTFCKYVNIRKLNIFKNSEILSNGNNIRSSINYSFRVRFSAFNLLNRNGDGVCMFLKGNLNLKIRDDLLNNDLELLFIQISNQIQSRFW